MTNNNLKCELCGCPVTVKGHTTKHYEIDIDEIFPEKDKWKETAKTESTRHLIADHAIDSQDQKDYQKGVELGYLFAWVIIQEYVAKKLESV